MRKYVSDESRKVPLSVSLSMGVREVLLAEATSQNLSVSAFAEKAIVEGLKTMGYPESLFDFGPKESVIDDTEKMDEYLRAYSLPHLNSTTAAREVGISTNTVYLWVRANSDFAEKFASIRSSKRQPGTSFQRNDADFAIIQRARSQQPGNGRRPIRELPRRGEESAATEM